jgi:hypothetical protein
MPIKRARKTAGGEPMYGGIPLNRWIRDFREGDFEARIAAAEAIEAMGPNGGNGCKFQVPGSRFQVSGFKFHEQVVSPRGSNGAL